MTKKSSSNSNEPTQTSKKPIVKKWEGNAPPSTEEAEARLHQEGYESFLWTDVPGVSYPRHRHEKDECIWVLSGEIEFTVEGEVILLKPGDRLYLESRTPHTARVPNQKSVSYLVGSRPRK